MSRREAEGYRNFCQRRGFRVSGIERIIPSLEDVFLYLLEQQQTEKEVA